MIVQIATLS